MLLGDIPTAYGMPWILSYALGIAVLFAVLRFAGSNAAEPYARDAAHH